MSIEGGSGIGMGSTGGVSARGGGAAVASRGMSGPSVSRGPESGLTHHISIPSPKDMSTPRPAVQVMKFGPTVGESKSYPGKPMSPDRTVPGNPFAKGPHIVEIKAANEPSGEKNVTPTAPKAEIKPATRGELDQLHNDISSFLKDTAKRSSPQEITSSTVKETPVGSTWTEKPQSTSMRGDGVQSAVAQAEKSTQTSEQKTVETKVQAKFSTKDFQKVEETVREAALTGSNEKTAQALSTIEQVKNQSYLNYCFKRKSGSGCSKTIC